MPERVFISYSSVDEDQALRLAATLEDAQVEYFLDRKDIRWGDDVTDEIRRGLSECSSIVVIISPGSAKSQWVPFEIGHALGLNKKVLPFLTHPAVDLPAFLQRLHYETTLDGVKEFFTLPQDSGVAEHNTRMSSGAPVTHKKPFDKADAAAQIMDGVVKGFARQIDKQPDETQRQAKKQDVRDKLRGLGQKFRMPPEVCDMYVDFMLQSGGYRPVTDFIQTLGEEEQIKSWDESLGKKITGWLLQQTLGGDGDESESQEEPTTESNTTSG